MNEINEVSGQVLTIVDNVPTWVNFPEDEQQLFGFAKEDWFYGGLIGGGSGRAYIDEMITTPGTYTVVTGGSGKTEKAIEKDQK